MGAKYAQDLLLLFFNIFFLDDSISNVTNIPIALQLKLRLNFSFLVIHPIILIAK